LQLNVDLLIVINHAHICEMCLCCRCHVCVVRQELPSMDLYISQVLQHTGLEMVRMQRRHVVRLLVHCWVNLFVWVDGGYDELVLSVVWSEVVTLLDLDTELLTIRCCVQIS
jgi:hypothetical protein